MSETEIAEPLSSRPTVSIVTAVYNDRETIAGALESVSTQSYEPLEYVVIDGESEDGTLEVIEGYVDDIDQFVSEPDEGIYDAFNKGVRATTGDIVGILNADDYYEDRGVIERVVEAFERQETDAVYGDLVYVDRERTDRIVRYWHSGPYRRERFEQGWMPPHPTFFARRELYEQYGGFDPGLDVSADYELMLRFLYRHRATATYVPEILVRMRTGGFSNSSAYQRLRGHFQDYQAWLENGEIPNPVTLIRKPLSKLKQFFAKPEALDSPEEETSMERGVQNGSRFTRPNE